MRTNVDNLWQKLKKAKENGTMMGCSPVKDDIGFILINDIDTGIMNGHAYSIIDVFELEYSTEEEILI